jgi:riboflavin-specific deaminase-like protein
MNLHIAIEHWLTRLQRDKAINNRPLVTLSYAQSLDGCIALQPSKPMILSGDHSLCLTHQLRSLHDGILVGIGTVLSDDPQLTVRRWEGPSPQPIILDSHLRIPPNAKLGQHEEKPCWVFTTQTPTPLGPGFDVIQVGVGKNQRVCLHETLARLHERGIRHVMVEGGANVITAFINAQLADAAIVTLSPQYVGGYHSVGDLELAFTGATPKLDQFECHRLGDDIVMYGQFAYPDKLERWQVEHEQRG